MLAHDETGKPAEAPRQFKLTVHQLGDFRSEYPVVHGVFPALMQVVDEASLARVERELEALYETHMLYSQNFTPDGQSMICLWWRRPAEAAPPGALLTDSGVPLGFRLV